MKSIKVNNFLSFFLYRLIAIFLFSGLTFFVTGKIADLELYVDCTYDGCENYGETTLIAMEIFQFLKSLLLTKILLIIFLASLSSTILYFLCRRFVDKNNFKYWALVLISPCLLIYTNVPTKELIFFYPSLIYIILESSFLIYKQNNIIPTLLKFSILPFMFYWRGYFAAPYLVLAVLVIFLKYVDVGKISIKLDTKIILIFSFIISTLLINIFHIFYREFFELVIEYLNSSFSNLSSQFRSELDYSFMTDPFNSIYIQYISLFPTLDELLNKPHQLLIVLESFILIYVFIGSWDNLFKILKKNKSAKKMSLVLLTFIGVSYFTIYGFVGSFNVGSAQRFRVNFIPLGIFFPLILEKNIREKHNQKLQSLKR